MSPFPFGVTAWRVNDNRTARMQRQRDVVTA
jgi:hypothetical protein